MKEDRGWMANALLFCFAMAVGFLYLLFYELDAWEKSDPWYEWPTIILTGFFTTIFTAATFGAAKDLGKDE